MDHIIPYNCIIIVCFNYYTVDLLCRIDLVDPKGKQLREPCDGGCLKASTPDPFPFISTISKDCSQSGIESLHFDNEGVVKTDSLIASSSHKESCYSTAMSSMRLLELLHPCVENICMSN
jgi:hypothetical protein